MLQSMRTYSRSAIAVLMFLFLILTFGAWGIGDIFRNRAPDPAVADVAGTEIHAVTLQQRFRQQLDQLQRRTGQSIPADQAIALGLPGQILQTEIQQIIRDKVAADYGLVVSDDFIRRALASEPAFRGANGSFDPAVYTAVLRNAGINEQTYIAGMKRDYAVDELFGSLTGGAELPPGYAELVYRYREEKRVADTALLPFSAIKDVPVPTEDQLKAYYEAHKAEFGLPEYRKLKFIFVKADDILSEIKIDPKDVRGEYDIRLNEFTTPESRDIDQVVLSSEDKANALVAAVKGGKSFEDAARDALGHDNAVIKLGTVKKTDLPAGLADPAFDLKEGIVSQPIRTALGWHVLRINKITPQSVKPFDAVKADLELSLKKQKAPDRLLSMSNDLEKDLNRGATFEEAAQKLGVKVQTVDAVDANGKAPGGSPAAGLPASKRFLPVAFSQRKGDESGIEEDPNGDFFVLQVENVMPARTPDLAEVKAKATTDWQKEEIAKLAQKKADAIVAKINAGATFASLAKADNIEIKTSPAVTRTADDETHNLPADVVGKLFGVPPGHAVSGMAPTGIAIAVVKSIEPADPAQDKEGVDKLAGELQQAMRGEVLTSFDRILRNRYPIRIDEARLAAAFPREQQ